MSNKIYDSLKTQGDSSVVVDEKIKEVQTAIDKAVDKYDPEAENRDENLEFHEKDTVELSVLFGRFADTCDYCLLANGCFWSFVMGASLPGFCLIFGELIDSMGEMSTQTEGESPLKANSLYMVYVAVGVFVSSAMFIPSFLIYSESIAHKIKLQYFEKAIAKDAAFYDEQNPNEMASKINKEASAVQRGLSEKVGNIVMSISGFVLGYVAAFWFGWKLSLILLGALPLVACSGVAFGASLESGQVEQMKAYAQSAGYAEQALQSIRIVHTYGNEELEFQNYSKYLSRAREKQRKSAIGVAIAYASLYALIFAFYAAAFYFGGLLKWEEVTEGGVAYTGGKIVAIKFCIVFGAMQMGGAGPGVVALKQAQIACKLAINVMDQVPIVNPLAPGKKLTKEEIKGEIEFKDVCFAYPSRKESPVLKNFSCVFESGKTTALVGPSGSGKSTIIQMIERFYKNDSGTIKLDGTPIEDLDLRNFRRNMGYVGQEPVLFNATIKENMKFAKPDATDQEIIDALNAANAYIFIQKMEKGLNTIVGGTGGSLSGGQKQRVAIARAFLKKPKILLLDEATSALDKVNEQIVQAAIDNYRKSNPITIVVIAHRLSTIRDADKIVVLVNGTLTEMGNHDQLMAEHPNGTYAEFVQKQASSEGPAQEIDSAQRMKEDELQEATPTKEPEEDDKKDQKVKKSISKKKTITDSQGRTVTIDRSADEIVKLEQADEDDEKRAKEIEDQLKPLRERSDFAKVMAFNTPQAFIWLACFAVAAAGVCQPLYGWVFSEFLQVLTDPTVQMENPLTWKEVMEEKVLELTWYTLIMAGAMFVGYVGKSYLFSYLGENVTLKVRELLYESILEKNIGWFDFQENQSSVLTSAMAQESAIINGASSESLGPYVEGGFAVIGGLVIGFVFCWQESLVTLGCIPLIVIGQVVGMEFAKGLSGATSDQEKMANLLIGDAINNLKTVQSFGYEELIVEKYKTTLQPIYEATIKKHIKAGISFGFSQFIVYLIFAGLFYFGGMIIEDSQDGFLEVSGMKVPNYTVAPTDVFIALFAIFFGANQFGMAMAMGPDIGKAQVAATKIFKIIEQPSEINAMKMDKDPTKKRLAPSQVSGKIEFKDVWFRYPTRKDDFVLKGLTLTINPNESVALVGESGCGKSTFVNLMMRFYDPQFGEILLDGVNIKELNLHDLRKGVSLVMQEPSIFNYSIQENLVYGKLDAKNSEIAKSAETANCNEFIEKGSLDTFDDSPQGLLQEMEKNKAILTEAYGEEKFKEKEDIMKKLQELEVKKGMFEALEGNVDTRGSRGVPNWNDQQLHKGFGIQCGLKGSKLSGGQKQRVAIARTLIGAPKILLLDEATSALDETSQKKVQQAIESAMENRTTIIIAHRMSTIEKCSKIFVLEEGKVKEEGNFNDLKAQGGAFSKLAQNKQN